MMAASLFLSDVKGRISSLLSDVKGKRPQACVPFDVPQPQSLNPFRTLTRHRNFRLFWAGQTLSLIGTWMQSMAQGWLALERSNSAFLVALVASAQSFPVLLLSMPVGVIVDRTDKLRLVKIAQTLLALEAAALWWFTWSHHITIGWLLV